MSWEANSFIKQVYAVAFDAVSSRLTDDVPLHHFYLLGQIENGHLHVIVVADALKCPLASVATYVVEGTDVILIEDNLQGLGKGGVAIKMVEVKPAVLHSFGET